MDNIIFSIQNNYFTIFNWDNLINFKILLLSVVLEAFPFMLLSVLFSAIMNNFISEKTLHRILPTNKYISVFIASLLGLIFPMCDCAIVPITRRLLLKGVPLHTAISFMLAAPIINPIVITATLYSFRMNLNIVLYRTIAALIISCTVSLAIDFIFKRHTLLAAHSHDTHHCSCHSTELADDSANKFLSTIRDASNEFFEMGLYLILGAMAGVLLQIFIPHDLLLYCGQSPLQSTLLMMLFAFFISVCSAADAFIAASFSSTFSVGSLIAFMVFGPMIDLKNTLMLLHTFKLKFVLCLIILVFLSCISSAFIVNQL